MSQITIQLNAPVASLEKFAELTGIPLATVRHRVRMGVYPIIPKKSLQERPQINLLAVYVKCAGLLKDTKVVIQD
jgi:hypothetical protein